jgi:hypothetical protein
VASRTVYKNKTISNLIPQLGQLLNDKIISQFAGSGLFFRRGISRASFP